MFEDFPKWGLVIFLTLAAGLTMPLGALVARWHSIQPRWMEEEFRHSVMAFGGGALLSAVALLLVPESIKNLNIVGVVLSFAGGGAVFAFLDHKASTSGTEAGNLVAMLADFLPEAMALGASCAQGGDSAILIALLIGLQNTPEGFSAFREMVGGGMKAGTVLKILFALSFMGPIFGLVGYFFLADQKEIISAIMLFASGGILYFVFQDIAPQAKLKQAWRPAMGAVLGFLLGLIGHMLTHG